MTVVSLFDTPFVSWSLATTLFYMQTLFYFIYFILVGGLVSRGQSESEPELELLPEEEEEELEPPPSS